MLYEELGIFTLLTQIKSNKFLDHYADRYIGKLQEADSRQGSVLCETLEAWLAHGGNANAAAKDLFIHRNTMRYRMEKIYDILNIESIDFEEALNLKMAFAIRKYRGSHRKPTP